MVRAHVGRNVFAFLGTWAQVTSLRQIRGGSDSRVHRGEEAHPGDLVGSAGVSNCSDPDPDERRNGFRPAFEPFGRSARFNGFHCLWRLGSLISRMNHRCRECGRELLGKADHAAKPKQRGDNTDVFALAPCKDRSFSRRRSVLAKTPRSNVTKSPLRRASCRTRRP